MRRTVALILALVPALPVFSAAQDGAAAQRAALVSDVAGFAAAAQQGSAARELVQAIVLSRRSLAGCSERRCLQAWGASFFPKAQTLVSLKAFEPLAGRLRLIDSEYRLAMSASVEAKPAVAVASKRPPAKAALDAAAIDPAALDKLYDGGVAGGAIPRVSAISSNWRSVASTPSYKPKGARPPALPPLKPAPPAPQRRSIIPSFDVVAQGSGPSPAAWSESIVRALFVTPPPKSSKRGLVVAVPDPIGVEYRMDDKGQIVHLAIPDHGYQEDRQFADGLVVRNTIRRGSETVEVVNQYDKSGRLVRRTAEGRNADGSPIFTAVDYDPATHKPRRGSEGGRGEEQVRLKFDLQGRPLNSVLLPPLPFAEPVASLVLDWQISHEDRLRILEDTRRREYHSPFWDGRWPGLSRGYTDPDLPKTWKRHPILGKKMPHEGIDLPMPEGTKVYPARRGKIIAVGWESGYGLRVRIQHYENNRPDGSPDEETVYGHLSKSVAKKGQWVTPGKDVIGLVGSTGLSTGPHLHFEVHESDGKAVDPMEKLSPSMPNRAVRAVLDPLLARAVVSH